MTVAVLIMALLLPVLMATAFLLGRHFTRRQEGSLEMSPVTRQHIDLFQGGQLSEVAVESAKARLRELLERGEVGAVEASLRPGTHYVIQVRALAEIGTDEAGRILERQLRRRLTDDEIEQSWYWIDLASGLRSLNREQSLPQLLRCAEAAGDLPLGHFFAAETICFLSFAGYLQQPQSPLGRTALRVLHRALEGLRCGVPPQLVAEARLGELIENLWDHRPETVDPLVVRVFAESLRLLARANHAERLLAEERAEQEAFGWQLSHLAALQPMLSDYVEEAPGPLCAALAKASPAEQHDCLTALDDLRAEASPVILPLLAQPGFPHAELAVHVLTWSRDRAAAPWLRNWVQRRVPLQRRVQYRLRALPPRRSSVASDIPYRAILRALRGHPSRETENFLLLAVRDWDPTFRSAAMASLGWWEPFDRPFVLHSLQEGRRDPSAEVRQAARAALARLGERQALQWFRQALTGENTQRVHETIQLVASEALTLLWPDLDRLADHEDLEIALHARESLERLREELIFPA
ncbi:MAG: HEAT repeat domain-containing protein [Gemmataceae bacterium]|nr:HEAT repeat domain-containing protein [Gemmataceae bacterium]